MAGDFSSDMNADLGPAIVASGPAAPAAPVDMSGGSFGAAPAQAAPGLWDKLSIINEALINTANNTVTTPDDGSDEWRVGSSAYEQWVRIMLYRRTWKFATIISPPLQRVGASAFPGYADVFAKPVGCMFLEDVWRLDVASLIFPSEFGAPSDMYNTMPPPLDYMIIGDQVHTTCGADYDTSSSAVLPAVPDGDFGPDFGPDFAAGAQAAPVVLNPLDGIVCKYVPFPSQSQPWSVGFVAALRYAIEATCFDALNEDFAQGAARRKLSEEALMEAASRNDSEEPRRVAFRSRLNERRRQPRYGYGSW